jgi:uncharacterized protein
MSKPAGIRRCIVTNEKLPKSQLWRLVKVNGKFVLDEKQVLPGRGVYVKNAPDLLQLALKKLNRNRKMASSSNG